MRILPSQIAKLAENLPWFAIEADDQKPTGCQDLRGKFVQTGAICDYLTPPVGKHMDNASQKEFIPINNCGWSSGHAFGEHAISPTVIPYELGVQPDGIARNR